MTATAHALVASFIASKVSDPALAGLLSLSSHFVMDTIPHWDFGTNWRARSKTATGVIAIADTLLGFTVAYLLFGGKVPLVTLFLCVALGNLPDWMEAPWYIFFANQKKKEPGKKAGFWEKTTYRIYRMENVFHTKAQFPFGVYTQIATVIFFFFLLK